MFQSISVLSGYPRAGETLQDASKRAHPQDHLDDLESILYILQWICSSFEEPGKLKLTIPSLFVGWDSSDALQASHAKDVFWMEDDLSSDLSPYFRPVFERLLNHLRTELKRVVMYKRRNPPPYVGTKTLSERFPAARADYEAFAAHIRQAIEDWESTQKAESELNLPHPRPGQEMLRTQTAALTQATSFTSAPGSSPAADYARRQPSKFKLPKLKIASAPAIPQPSPRKKRSRNPEEDVGADSDGSTGSNIFAPQRRPSLRGIEAIADSERSPPASPSSPVAGPSNANGSPRRKKHKSIHTAE